MAKEKLRGFIMTGGGAKGMYEAGVINAFHITGMEFNIITGSSIGAMNAAFYSEYLYHKSQLPPEVRGNPESAIHALDSRVRAYHHVWLQMPDKKLIDDSETGPIGRLKDDLENLDLNLPLLARLGWWWTDPNRNNLPPAETLPALTKLGFQLIGHVGGAGSLLNLVKFERGSLFHAILRKYLSQFGIDRALIPPDQDHKLKDMFTTDAVPLTRQILEGTLHTPEKPEILVDPRRTMRDYYQENIIMRVTRTNYRTGRMEISAYVPMQRFVNFMEKQAWRLKLNNLEKVPLGSFRLQVPGNPNVVNAALCSGRFPGVFAPFPLSDIYSPDDPDNSTLYRLLTDWMKDPQVAQTMREAYLKNNPLADPARWESVFNNWRSSDLREYFPKAGDFYVDGGTIDNTPSNSAVDYVRETSDLTGQSRRDVKLELFVIYLDEEPKIDQDEMQDPSAFQVVNRTVKIQGVGKASSDANTVDVINTFGERAESLGLALKLVIAQLRDALGEAGPQKKQELEERIQTQARQLGLKGFLGEKPTDILNRMENWANNLIERGLPVEVNAVKIFPVSMDLDTLQFTERFGYKKENALKMLTAGCFDTLWTMRQHLEELPDRDERDNQVLAMARKWMRLDPNSDLDWPANSETVERDYRAKWACQRSNCVYFEKVCAHGALIRGETS